jgi:hypothetical protein
VTAAVLTYVYCLVRTPRRPTLRAVPAGLSGSRDLRLLAVPPARRTAARNDLWIVAASVPAREYGEDALQRGLQNLDWVGRRALEHEAVVEHFLRATAVLPMQLFTLFTSDERAIAHVTADRRRITGILARVEGQLEWGLRLTWDEKAARDTVERAHTRSASGVDYLARKRDLLDVNRSQLAAAKGAADRLYKALANTASDARRRSATEQAAPGSRLLLDAAFLVPAGQAATFRGALRRNARQLGKAGLVVSLTGPWPPYNFI